MPTPSAIYQKAHRNVVQQRGHATEHFCGGYLAPCGRTAKEWAFIERGLGSFEVTLTEVKDGHRYTRTRTVCMDAASYEPMCRSCHKRMDNHFAQMDAELKISAA